MDLRQILSSRTILAFNLDDFTVFRGVFSALSEKQSPAIFQLSPGEAHFWGLENFVSLLKPYKAKNIFLNIDHGKEFRFLEKAINLGFDLVHFDGSELPWKQNLEQTTKIVKMAHAKGVLVEGEPQEENTDPQKAAEFVRQTNVDLIAVFCGNKHGFNPYQPENLDFEKLKEVKKAVGRTLLTLHGGSGVPPKQLKKAQEQKLVAKININSLLRDAYFKALKKQISQYPGQKIYELLAPVEQAVKKKVLNLF